MKTIPKNEIQRNSNIDRHGYVFKYKGRLFRGIYNESIQGILDLINSGLIDELVKGRLFPETSITDFNLSDCNLVLEHKFIQPIIYPSEWSFEMLKAAALATIKINLIAIKYGYNTIDAHGNNVLFDNGDAIFIDIGSFIKVGGKSEKNKFGWRAYEEYLCCFYYPLVFWKNGLEWIARQSIIAESPSSPYFYFSWKHPLLFRLTPSKIANKAISCFFACKAVSIIPDNFIKENLCHTNLRRFLADCILFFKRNKLLLFSNVNFSSLCRKTEKIILNKGIKSQWDNYHDLASLTYRFEKIIEYLKSCNIKTILEIGGNSGFLSKAIESSISDIDRIICTDYDNAAIDKLYKWKQNNKNSKIIPALLNIKEVKEISSDNSDSNVLNRFRSDVVLCLALIHHLTISQGLSLEFIFQRLKSFSNKYVFVEYMPLGLYSDKYNCAPIVPEWYNYGSFKNFFLNHFDLIKEEQLEKNRILFIGSVKNSQ